LSFSKQVWAIRQKRRKGEKEKRRKGEKEKRRKGEEEKRRKEIHLSS